MSALGASDVAYTLQEGTQFACPSDPHYRAVFKLVFGDGSLTYPSGGVPLTKAKLGCSVRIVSLQILDNGSGDGYDYKYDYANDKIRIYNSQGSHTHDIKAIGGLTSSEALFLDASQSFGKNAATDRTIVGSTSATTGGVVASTAGAGDELGTSDAIADSTTLYVHVVGF